MSQPWYGQAAGSLADIFIPGDAYNPKAPSFGEGWTTSGWGRGFSQAQQGNYAPLGGEIGSVAGGRFIPIPFFGSRAGKFAGNWLGNLLSGNRGPTIPQFSEYGPYSGDYRGLPGGAVFGAGYNPGDVGTGPALPEFFGEGPNYIMPEEVAPDNYVQIKNPAKPSWQSMGRDDKAHSGWSGVMGKGANGETLIRGVQFFGGLGGGMGAEGQKAYKKRDPSE